MTSHTFLSDVPCAFFCLWLFCLIGLFAPATAQQTVIKPGQMWLDTKGEHINAHGGGILFHERTYYWYGEHKVGGAPGNKAQVGVHVYSSKDLYNWTDEGIALEVSSNPDSDIAKGCVLERPKVIFNAKTKKFVMWFHLELKGRGYSSARSGIAVADNVTGPFTFVRSIRPNAGHWPQNVTPEEKDPKSIARTKAEKEKFSGGPSDKHKQFNILGSHMEGGQMARDMTLFVDDDGKAYHLYSSEHNSTLHISLLTDDYLDHAGSYVRVFPFRWMEAPAICKHEGRYYLIASGCTGWSPNAARSAVADNIFGPWEELENPCMGVNPQNQLGPEKTFGGQSTFILPVEGKPGAFIAMFDIWRPKDPITGTYVWLPIQFEGDRFKIEWMDEWDLSVFLHR
ncbi:glycoside hydrolase family 43 protein [Coraliomargarita algicola]